MLDDMGSINVIRMEDLLKLSNPGLVAFKCDKTMKIQFVPTNSIQDCIGGYTRLLRMDMHEIMGLNEDKNDLKVLVLMIHPSIRFLKYITNNYIEYAKKNGYTMYRDDYNQGNYTFHEVIEGKAINLYIRGKSRALSSMLLVGKFNTMEQCTEFKSRGMTTCLSEIID